MVPGAVAAGEPSQISAPFDRAPIATVEQVDHAGVERALATADALFRNRDGWLSPGRRIEILGRAAAILHERREQLALEAAREGGKPLVDSLIEADRAVDSVRLCAEHLRSQAGVEVPMDRNAASAGRLAFTHHEPIGVVLAFSAFNHPLNLIAHQVGPAVAAGCPVVVKPAKAAPLSCFRFVRILREAGLPDEWCQPLLTTDQDLARTMVSDRRVGFFSFIGSGEVGWALRSELAPGARCSLEHGGVAPVIVAADADLDYAVPLLTKGGFYHAGQVCVSVQRVYAQRKIARALAERLAEAALKLKVGDPTLPDTAVGPLIREKEVARVDAWVQEAVQHGASALCGGRAVSAEKGSGPICRNGPEGAAHKLDPTPFPPVTCYAPTVLLDPPADTRVMSHEVFGPVVCVSTFDELDDAIVRANALPYAFQAAVFTRDLDTALRTSRRLNASAVMINDHTAFRVDWMPFAGLRESGFGTGGIPYTMEDMQVQKMIVIRSKEL
jgi:acyl-CoA reductase-like NAD-dependent aldehyde dehydrogenase